MSKPYRFQLAYTITPLTQDDERHADKARTHMREKMGWKTIDNLQTTLLGVLNLTPGDDEAKRREARSLVRNGIRAAFLELEVDKRIIFESSLMVSGLDPAMALNIIPD